MAMIFHKFEEVRNLLNDPKYRHLEPVNKLWDIYNTVKNAKKDTLNQNEGENLRKHPLIVIEGLDGSGKTTITYKLAEKIKAALYRTPPLCTDGLRGSFDDCKPLRRVFYAMGNYIAAEEIKKLLEEKPVVLDRYLTNA
ncbi:UMP-CMP kinase 2, mitochondrial-like [Agrilus planipennis]|uniref:UMP-CMP kinase 2, mitochondrial-like n=1 Tax=Agrilus planipennis TaxID=224129 RepID=A0A1W4XRA6_AGRPL|nr:UMP-CMP kinase 2, mitochondrial-like [Agrilus planipennis]